jgi:hypothetical protein
VTRSAHQPLLLPLEVGQRPTWAFGQLAASQLSKGGGGFLGRAGVVCYSCSWGWLLAYTTLAAVEGQS